MVRTIQKPFKNDAIARAATKIGKIAATTVDCASAVNTAKKRTPRNLKKWSAPGLRPMLQ